MALLNVNNPGDIVLDQAPEPLPVPKPAVTDDVPNMPNLMATIPVGAQVIAANQPRLAPPPVAPAPAPPRFTKLSATDNVALDPAPTQSYDTKLSPRDEAAFQQWKQIYAPNDSGDDYDLRGAFKAGLTPDPATGHWADTFKKPNHPTFSDQSQYANAPGARPGSWNGDKFVPPPTQLGIQKLPQGAQIKLDTSATDYLKMAGKALVRGAVEGGTDVAHAASPFTDRPAPGNISNEEFINDEPHAPSAPIKTDDVSKIINAPIWDGSVRDAAGNLLVKTAHNLGQNAPAFGLGIAGAAAGGSAGGPIGAAAGGAAGFGAGSALQEIAPAYQRARADGLDHDAAVDRAIKETIVAGGIGTIAGLVPEVKFFGKSWKLAGTGPDGIAEMVKMARKPVSEALAQVFGVQPAVGAAQQAIDASIENKPLTPAQIAEGYVSNAATGAVLTGLHGIKNMAFPVKEQVGGPTAAPGTATGAGRAQPPVMDAEVVQSPSKLPPPAAGGAPEQPSGPATPPQPAPGGATVEVPLSRDDLAAAIQNGTPLPKSKVINLPDVPIDPALKAQGYTVGNKVQQITSDGEVHEGTVASARHGDGEIEVTMVDPMGNLRTLFSSDGPIKAAQVPQAAPPAPAQPAAPTVAAPVPPAVSQPIPPPAPAVPPPQKPENLYAQMDMEALKNSLDFVNSHGKQNGWNRSSTATKRAITEQLNSRFPEWQLPARADIANAAAEVAPSPTDAQKEAGNYQKGHVSIQGLPVTLENPKGSIRSGVGPDGQPWQVEMPAHYGYVKRTEGADGDHVDVYVGNHPSAPHVYVIDQIDPHKQVFDEHKSMLGFESADEALKAYQAAFSDGNGLSRIGAVTQMTIQEFKTWLRKPGARRAPLAWEKPQEPAGINHAIQKRVDDLINIAKTEGNLAADKAFQRMRKKLSAGEQEEVKKAFADAYRKEGLADAPKPETVTTENKPALPPAVVQELFIKNGDKLFQVKDFKDASEKWQKFVAASGLGASETHPVFIVDQTGKEVATISYNGRVWPPGEWTLDQKPLYDPRSEEKIAPVPAPTPPVPEVKNNETRRDKRAAFLAKQFPESDQHVDDTNVVETNKTEQNLSDNTSGGKVDLKVNQTPESKPAPTLSEKAFYKQYVQHIDIRGRDGSALANLEKIKSDGFKSGMNVNALPPSRGGEPTNIIDKKFAPKKGDVVYLIPKSGWENKPNGAQIKAGWKPEPYEVIIVEDPKKSMYENYLEAKNGAVQQGAVQSGIPDRISEKAASLLAKADEGQNAESAPQGEGGRGGEGVQPRSSVSDEQSRNGQGAGGEGGNGDRVQRDDGVPKGLEKTFGRLDDAISAKDAPMLRDLIGNLDNKKTRARFEEKTGIALPKTKSGTLKAIDDFAGISTEQRSAIDAARDEKVGLEKAGREAKAAERALSGVKIKTDDGTTVDAKAWADKAVADGFDVVAKKTVNGRTEYVLVNKDGAGYSLTKFKGVGTDIRKYVISVTGKEPINGADFKPEEKRKTRDVAGKEMPEPIGASLQVLRRMDTAVSKTFASNPDMSDEQFAELEKYALDVQEEIEKHLIKKASIVEDSPLYSLGNKAADRLQSTLLKTANAMRQGKGTGDQILGYLRKQAGVKEEEIAWTGLDDFLKGKTGVTKEDVVNYLKENQVKIHEVTLGGTNGELPEGYELEQDDDLGDGHYVVRNEDGRVVGSGPSARDALEAFAEEGGATKFSQYTLPGGENYREVLMTLPDRVDQARSNAVADFAKRMREKYGERWSGGVSDEEEKEYNRLLDEQDAAEKQKNPQFKSTHFDQPNILAHVRLNDRTDADGKKVLFVEEIQSDWHQKGRKQGYKIKPTQEEAEKAGYSVYKAESNHGTDAYFLQGPENDKRVTNHGFDTEQEAWKELLAHIEKNSSAVPDAPFKKTWHEMAFRRVAQMAAQGGYDRVAWTTGEQQNDRFDLSKQLDRVLYWAMPNGKYGFSAFEVNNKSDIPDIKKNHLSESELETHLGKDITKKIIDREGKTNMVNETQYGQLSGIDLKVGGEGMKGFYDKIIPRYASKFGKKFGAEVGKTTLPVEYNNGEYVYKGTIPTPEQVKEVHEISKGRGQELTSPITGKKMEYSLTRVAVENPLRKIVKRMDSGESFKDAFAKEGTPEIAEIFGGEATDAKNAESLQVHSMSITPAMRESADAGFELFKQKDANLPVTEATARAGDIQSAINEQMKKQGYTDANVKLFSNPEETGIAGVDKNAEGVYHNGIIHISMDAADPLKVLNHETIHELRAAGAFTDAEWKTLEAKSDEWRKKYNIDENYAEHDLSDRQLKEEAIAHAFQDHKVQGIFRRIANRVMRFIKAIGDFLRGKKFNFKTAEDVFDAVAKGEVSGRESAKAGREAIQERVAGTQPEFPKYSLGKGKKASLDEARETLASIHGLGRNLTDDLKRVSAAILHPQQIATLHKEFTLVYRAVIERFKQREVNIHNLAKSVDAYNKMDEGAKNNVNAALELGRLEGETYKPDDKGEIIVKNEGQENAVFSKPDETVKLSPAEAAAYQGVRKAMDDAHDMMLDVVLERFGLLKKGAKTIQDVEKMRAAAIKDGDLNEATNLGKALKALNEVADSKKSGYTPFKRWGEVGISVKNEEGDLVHFERVELPQNFIQRKGKIGDNKTVQDAVNRLAEKYNKTGYSINTFEMPKFFDDPATVDLREFDKLLAKSDIPAADKEHVREVLQTEMTKRGFSSHFIKAKDTPGYSPDFERAINDYIVKASSYAARVLNERHIEDAVSGITTTGKKNLHDYATKYVDYVNSPDEELAVIRHLGFTWYLAGNISSGLVNATQPLILTAPWFHAKFSHPEIGKAMTKAYADTIKMVDIKKMGRDIFDFSKAPADVRDALIKAYNEGDFMSLATNDAMAISSTTQALRGLDKAKRAALDTVGMTFSVPEKINRIVTFIAAYRLAMKPGAQDKIQQFIKNDELGKSLLHGKNSPEAFAFAYAEHAVFSTQFRVGKYNRPQVGRGFGSLMFQFQSYNMQYLEAMYKLNKVNGGKAKKALGAILLTIIAIAGLKGLPFEDDTQKLIEALFKFFKKRDLDIDTDVREALIKYTHSPAIAEGIIHGIPSALGVNLSGRLGFGNIIPDTQAGFMGPWWNLLIEKPALVAKDLSEGHYQQALADGLPTALANPLTGYIWTHDGVRTQKGAKIIDASKVSEADRAIKTLGFTPSDVSQKRDEAYAADRANAAVNDLRTSYNNKLARLIVANGKLYDDKGKLLPGATKEQSDQLTGQVQATLDEINRYNKTVPVYQMVIPNRSAIKKQVLKEIEGSESMKPRKQDRMRNEEIKQIYSP